MVHFEDLDGGKGFYRPYSFPGLEAVVRLPGSERKSSGLLNSMVWVFKAGASYDPRFLGRDIGCGMAALVIPQQDVKNLTDALHAYFKERSVLGRGNHFIDVCSSLSGIDIEDQGSDYNVIVIHTHGNSNRTPKNITQALREQKARSTQRADMGLEFAEHYGINARIFGNWSHNSVEVTDQRLIYRKGSVKVNPGEIYLLPAHLGSPILLYTVTKDNNLPFSSMPHATGRVGPRGETKVSSQKARETRDLVYVPEMISDSSLRTEHPSCYNGFDTVFQMLRSRGFVPVAEMKILGYVGKV